MRKTVAETLIEYLKAELDTKFKLYREGDPGLIPPESLPALFISESQTDYNTGPTQHDEIMHSMIIQVVLNKKDDFGNPNESESLDKQLQEIVQGRDEDTGYFADGTIIKALRNNLTMGNLFIENIGTVRFGVIVRSEDLMTQEAHIDLSLSEIQAIENRS